MFILSHPLSIPHITSIVVHYFPHFSLTLTPHPPFQSIHLHLSHNRQMQRLPESIKPQPKNRHEEMPWWDGMQWIVTIFQLSDQTSCYTKPFALSACPFIIIPPCNPFLSHSHPIPSFPLPPVRGGSHPHPIPSFPLPPLTPHHTTLFLSYYSTTFIVEYVEMSFP